METVAYICMETSYNSINVLVAKAECGHALKGLALPCASHIGESALEGSRGVTCIPRWRGRQSFSCQAVHTSVLAARLNIILLHCMWLGPTSFMHTTTCMFVYEL